MEKIDVNRQTCDFPLKEILASSLDCIIYMSIHLNTVIDEYATLLAILLRHDYLLPDKKKYWKNVFLNTATREIVTDQIILVKKKKNCSFFVRLIDSSVQPHFRYIMRVRLNISLNDFLVVLFEFFHMYIERIKKKNYLLDRRYSLHVKRVLRNTYVIRFPV